MPRGLWTQAITVLTRSAPTLDALRERLADREPKLRETDSPNGWMGAPQGLLVPYRPEVNGWIELDVVPSPYPDPMGDPKNDADLFGAWTMGSFGPGAFPGNLNRAVRHCVACPDAAEAAAAEHAAFVRARIAYVYGAGEDAVLEPEDRDPVDELWTLADVASTLLEDDDALAWFHPGGEVILDPPSLAAALKNAIRHRVPPLDVFAHVRIFRIGDVEGWAVMDTVGTTLFGLPDNEACVPQDRDPNEVASWLRQIQLYLLESGPVIEVGHTVDGPGGDWRALTVAEGLIEPPRPTLRWAPEGVELPDVLAPDDAS